MEARGEAVEGAGTEIETGEETGTGGGPGPEVGTGEDLVLAAREGRGGRRVTAPWTGEGPGLGPGAKQQNDEKEDNFFFFERVLVEK